MKHQYLSNIPLDTAKADYLKFLKDSGLAHVVETMPVVNSLGRTTANAVYAAICSPHYNACAMDGIALKAKLTFNATETTPVPLSQDQFIRVDTGDPLPEGCDAVVMIEDCVESGDEVLLYQAAAPWQNVRQIGEDISAGDMILPSYTVIEPASIGAMLAGGVLNVDVIKKPRVAIIPTGDEVVPPTRAPQKGDVMEFNSSIFSGMLSNWGAEAVVYPIVKDDPKLIEAAVAKAASECDAVLLMAGTSAGRDDDTTEVMRRLGEVLYHGIAIKPGKPAALGRIGSKPVLGVPGYPVSGILVLEHLFKPVIDFLLKRADLGSEQIEVKLSRRLNSSLKYREFIRATLSRDKQGELVAVPLNRGAGVVTSFVKADCILDIPQDAEGYEAGESVPATLTKDIRQIDRTIKIIGSHDPLIDEAADVLRRSDPNVFVSSAPVGSMGGITAVLRGEAQLAGVHLLNEADGSYNTAYVERYFKNGGVALVECVQRVQGLMTAAGNPKGLTRFEDVAREGISYVNRQKGSGTRILCDYLMKSAGISPDDIYGYSREEFTHTGVAAQIAAGTADCGMGILSAARIYGLDFIPVCLEQYDILIPLDALDNPMVQAFINTLKTPEFKARLIKLGGYEISDPGRIRQIWK